MDGFYDALLALPEFENFHALAKACKSYAELPAAEDRSTYNLFAETPHFYVWLRLINRERDTTSTATIIRSRPAKTAEQAAPRLHLV